MPKSDTRRPDFSHPRSRDRPLPVPITRGMPVVEIDEGLPATIVGISEAFCVYRLAESDALGVAPWRNVALGNICPAKSVLPRVIEETDRANASATVLRELLALKQFGLTTKQAAALDELVAQLCNEPTTTR